MTPAEIVAPAWEAIKAHPFITLGGLMLSSGVGANILARALNKIPLGPWFKLLESVGRAASRVGNLRFHKPLWEPFETWFLGALVGSVKSLENGLRADNGVDLAANPKAGPPDGPGGDPAGPWQGSCGG